MSDIISRVFIQPAENGFVVEVHGSAAPRTFIAQNVDRLADVLYKVFPNAGPSKYVGVGAALGGGPMHKSDCAIYDAPALAPGRCDCGAAKPVMMPVTGGANG
jgi:hypothetical protein